MAITTSDGLVRALATCQPVPFYKTGTTAEAAGVLHATIFQTGTPGAVTAPSPGVNGAAVTSATAGFIPFIDASVGNQKYLGAWEMSGALTCGLILCDMLWWNSGINVTTTTGQSISAATMASRDANGSTDGEGVEAGILVSTATTNGSAITNTTFTYTNSYGGGAIHLVLFRRLSMLSVMTANLGQTRNFFDAGCKMWNGSAPFILQIPTGTSSGNLTGQFRFIEG